MASQHPPRPTLTLNVGITGHRANILPAGAIAKLSASLDMVFLRLREAVERLHTEEQVVFSGAAPQLRLHTPLATGADQLAAESAHRFDYQVRALLPFDPSEYSRDFAEGKEHAQFAQHLGAADEVFALPGERGQEDHAYTMVGKAVIAAADVLIAVWDGREGNGPGGTAHIVDLAIRGGVPIIHIEVDRDTESVGEVNYIYGGNVMEPITEAMDDTSSFDDLVRETLAPHTEIERELIAEFYAERQKLINLRIEYPLLLALLGIKRLPKSAWRQSPISEDIERDRNDSESDRSGTPPTLHQLAYAWSNFLAIRNAQRFRSGHLTNYALSVLAVFLALSGLILPDMKVYLVVAELLVIWLLFYNTRAGRRGEWHRRWLQYRHLAESLRPLVYLKRTGMAGSPFRTDLISAANHRIRQADWTRWYTAAIWREMPSPTGTMTDQRIDALVAEIVDQQIVPQSAYHSTNAIRMQHLDHRLHELGNLVMGTVIAACFMYLAGYVLVPHAIKQFTGVFIILTAGLPTLGAALFGLRGHGEHLLAASRSFGTVDALGANAERLKLARSLEGIASEMENTSAIMLADLNEWTISYSERTLEVPG